jgi:hypothetical protein
VADVIEAESIPFWDSFRARQAVSSFSIFLVLILCFSPRNVKENISLGLRLAQRSLRILMLRSKNGRDIERRANAGKAPDQMH